MIYLAIFAGGLLLTILLVYPVERLAFQIGAISSPGGRSIHAKPMPLLGGLAIYLACLLLGLLFLVWNRWDISSLTISWSKLMGLFFGATFLLMVGIIDDIKALRARWKLLGQFVAICIPVLFGFTIQAIQLPFVGSIKLGGFGLVLFVLWVLGITNAVNLTDGIDGLASVVCFFAAVGNGIIAIILGNVFIAFFSFMLAGCLVGFLFHNFPPAHIFLGDTGSMLLGFLLAVAVIESNTQKRSTTLLILAPLLLLGFSLLDVLLSVIRRFLRGKPIFSSDLGHIHHRLMTRFRNPRRVLFVVACFSSFMVIVSVVTHFSQYIPSAVQAIVYLLALLITILFVRLLGYFRSDRILYVLRNRDDVKFFSALLSYLQYSLPRVSSKQTLMKELNWVCQAMKPDRVVMFDEKQEVVCYYTNTYIPSKQANTYQEELKNNELKLQWSHSTLSDEPSTCDIRLMWRELFGMFAKEWCRLTKSNDNDLTLEHSSYDDVEAVFPNRADHASQAEFSPRITTQSQVLNPSLIKFEP